MKLATILIIGALVGAIDGVGVFSRRKSRS